MQTDVIIVGGGIGGGVLAALLARGGKRVVTIERNPEGSSAIVRPEVLWPATVDILFSLIPRDEWDDALVAVRGIEFARGHQELASIDAKTFQQAGVHPWSTDPNLTRAKLLARSDVHRGVEAVGLLRNGNRTEGVRARNVATGAEFAIHAEWTIGDDGAHSRVRADCGIAMETRRFPVEFFCFGFDWPATFPPATVRAFVNPARSSAILSLAAIPLPNGKGAGLVPVSADRLEKSEDVRAGWNAFRSSHPSIAEVIASRSFPDDFVHVRREWGHAPRYGAAGVLLMGDAVHPVSPAGGQGANMSIHDASVLGELLLEDHPRLLDEYERRRRPANERSVQISARAARFFKLRERGGIRGRILALLPALLRRRWFAARMLRRAATTFVGE